MAKVSFHSPVAKLRGKIDEFVFSENDNQPVAYPFNPAVPSSSSSQLSVRSTLQYLSSIYSSLSSSQVDSWRAFARLYPRSNALGVSRFLSPAQAFIMVNYIGQRLEYNAPSGLHYPIYYNPPSTEPVWLPPCPVNPVLSRDSGGNVSISFDYFPWNLGGYILWRMTPAIRTPAAKAAKRALRDLSLVCSLPFAAPIPADSMMEGLYGFPSWPYPSRFIPPSPAFSSPEEGQHSLVGLELYPVSFDCRPAARATFFPRVVVRYT